MRYYDTLFFQVHDNKNKSYLKTQLIKLSKEGKVLRSSSNDHPKLLGL